MGSYILIILLNQLNFDRAIILIPSVIVQINRWRLMMQYKKNSACKHSKPTSKQNIHICKQGNPDIVDLPYSYFHNDLSPNHPIFKVLLLLSNMKIPPL